MSKLNVLKFINVTLGFLWFYQGLIPKVLFIHPDEIAIWQHMGLAYDQAQQLSQASGIAEIFFGLLFLFFSNKYLHVLNILGLVLLFFLVAFLRPYTLVGAFNPVVMNVAMINLSILYLLLHGKTILNTD